MQKIIIYRNDETGTCDVMDVSEEGLKLFPDKPIADCAQDWRGWWYLINEVPEKPTEIKAAEVRKTRDYLLSQTDKYMTIDYPISVEEREMYKLYRQYLRDIPLNETFPNIDVKIFEDWKNIFNQEK